MRVIIQRVLRAEVSINKLVKSEIGPGMLIFLGIGTDDGDEDIEWLCHKITGLRIFDDENKIPNLSVKEIAGDILLVSQFTLHAMVKKGNRPSYIRAAKPDVALPVYEHFIRQLEMEFGKPVQIGSFGANMQVSLTNDGPITIWIDSKNRE